MAENTAAAQQEMPFDGKRAPTRRRVEKKTAAKHQMKWEVVFNHLDRASDLLKTNKPTEAVEEIDQAANWSKKWTTRSREETSMGLTILTIIENDVMGAFKKADASKLDGAIGAVRKVVQRQAYQAAVNRSSRRIRSTYKRPTEMIRERAVEDAIASVAKELGLRRRAS